jgi:hypothetical protein
VAGPQGDPGTNGVGVPTGGTAGQFLRKSSGVDYATAFAAIPTSEVTGLDTALAGKVGTASPTFTGTVTLPTQVAGTAGLIYPPGAYLSTPAAGAIEMDAEGLYVTPNTDFGRRRIKAQAVVCSQANSGAATTTTLVNCFAAANDVLSSLAANHTYKVRGVLFFQSTFTSGTPNLRIAWTFSNAPTVIKYTFKTMTATAGTALARTGLVTSAAATQVTANVTSTLQYAVEIDMFIVTHASAASTFTPQFSMSVTGVSMVCAQGSYLEVEEYGSSTATLIAGGWA